MKYRIKSILWVIVVTIMFCLLNSFYNPTVYPPTPGAQQHWVTSPSMHLTGIPTHMVYTEIK